MFNVEKIQQITTLLEKMPENFDDVYVVHDGIFIPEAAALFKRMKIPIRAIMHDTMPEKELFGWPAVKTAEASKNFNERTALIVLVKKPVPFVQTTFKFKVNGGTWTIPALIIANEEIAPIYDRVAFLKVLQQYKEDGIFDKGKQMSDLTERFARGLTSSLDPRFQNFKYQLWDRRRQFKPTYDFDDTAIVLQGPIVYENNYTVDTLKLYRSIYPNAPIVVSTWKGEATNAFCKECRENSIVLLENEVPKNRAPFNVNLQLESSLQGVKYIRENTSAKFVLKTRTDQRINYFDFLVYFKNLLETFPPKGDKLQRRIIFLNSTTSRTWPFFFCDFLAFGHAEDILKLYSISRHQDPGKLTYLSKNRKREGKLKSIIWSSPVDYNSVTEQNRKLYNFNKLMSRICHAEDYIARTFYEEYIAPLDETKILETSWKFAVDYLIFIDENAIFLDWPKYEDARYDYRLKHQDKFAFARWLDMYRNFKLDWV